MAKRITIIVFIICLVGPSAGFADHFKFTDANGKVHYTDNHSRVPPDQLEKARFEFDPLPPVNELPPPPPPATNNLFAISAGNSFAKDNDPALRQSLEKALQFFKSDFGKYNKILNYPPSIAKYRVLRKEVLKTTGPKQVLLFDLAEDSAGSVALTIATAYLQTSIKNDGIMAKWNNLGNRFTESTGDNIDPDTGELEIIQTKTPSGNGMTQKLTRRLLAEDAQKTLIRFGLKLELDTL